MLNNEHEYKGTPFDSQDLLIMLAQVIAPTLSSLPSQNRNARSVALANHRTRQIIADLTNAGNLLLQHSPAYAILDNNDEAFYNLGLGRHGGR